MISYKKILALSFIFLLILFVGMVIFGNKVMNKNKDIEELLNENEEAINSDVNVVANLRGVDESDAVIGNLDSKVEVVVYEDLSDAYSVKLNETLSAILENFSDDVVVAFRPYVDKTFPLSYPTYSLAECAKDQGKFFEARKMILEKVATGEWMESEFSKYFSDLGLNVDEANKCLLEKKHLAKIENLTKEAEDFGVYGSPVIFVNKELVVGARSFDDVVNGSGEKLPGVKNIVSQYLN